MRIVLRIQIPLDKVTQEPFGGEALRYRQVATGYVVYSIGRNRRDDEGKEGWQDGDLTPAVGRSK